MESTDRILSQILKLMATANSPTANENEAAAAMGRIRHLMAKHGLDEAQVERATRADGSSGVRIHFDPDQMTDEQALEKQNLTRWDKYLSGAVATACGCKSYSNWRGVHFYGVPQDVAVACVLYRELLKTMSTQARRWAKRQREEHGRTAVNASHVATRTWKDGFCQGVYDAVRATVDHGEEKMALPCANDPGTTALVLVEDVRQAKREALVAYRKKQLPTMRKARRSPGVRHSARASDFSDGKATGRAQSMRRDGVS